MNSRTENQIGLSPFFGYSGKMDGLVKLGIRACDGIVSRGWGVVRRELAKSLVL